ncbi:penicillin-binding protein 1A [Faunimonas pinastri]|uniref:Penicillin-binding protein 1A n=1 Tax=Faunimonas pinastri TaxID=1855383 RepID=A0A1H9M9V5_9HYPH|nr:PBP1A family penicillin-binding protein [Faunimonas pinastri]SER20235.1 penicillin-binding protein 1A [Faunimonas pinastri]
MRDLFRSRGKRRWFRALEFDAWLDSTLYEGGQSLGRNYERLVIFMRRFRVHGFSRALAEIASESATLGVAGLLVLLAFALPAFDAVKKDWRSQGEYAVTFLDRYGNVIGRRGVLQDSTVQLADIPDNFIKALLSTEDRRFFDHFGIDIIGTLRAISEDARAGGVVQGGSSLTQQLAKNVFLSNERTLERKIKEAYLALWLEANLSKREILTLYLNRAYMGGGTFGVAAAADFYFGKKVQDLSLAECAMLAGLFKAPTKYAPHINLPAARARANDVLSNMVQAGFMTEGQVIGARLNPATPVQRTESSSPDYFLDWAFDEVKKNVTGTQKVLIARTTIDMRLQKAAEAAIESSLREKGEAYDVKQAAMVSMEPDGSVRAMVGGRDYGESTFNRAVNALRQPGSSFKPYVYATALEQGMTPATPIVDAPITIGNWSPQNFEHTYMGHINLKTGLTHSINTVAVRLSTMTGRQPIADLAKRMGVATPIRVTRSLPLGTSEVSVLDQATGYSVFANGGFRITPHALIDVRTPDGKIVWNAGKDLPAPVRVLKPSTVLGMVDMMHNVVENGTARRAHLPGINAAGKTGTAQDYRDAWFCGYTGNYVTTVWFGNDNYKKMNRMTGGTLPAETWQKYMRVAHAYVEIKPLPGLAPPSDAREDAATANASMPALNGGEQIGVARLPAPLVGTLGQMEQQFRRAARTPPPLREAALQLPTAD